jgi:lipoprotein-releasing system permease protein
LYKLKLILRYLTRRRITLVPILAVTVAVFLLIVVLAVMRGFGMFIEEKLRGMLADVLVESDDVRGFDGWEGIAARLRKLPDVASAAPHLSGKGMLTVYAGEPRRPWDFPCLFVGIDPDAEDAVTRIDSFLIEGEGLRDHLPLIDDMPGLILGNEVLGLWKPPLFAVLSLTTPTAFDEDSSMFFRITAKFKTGLYEHDRTTVYVPLTAAQKLLRLPGRVTSLHVRARGGADLAKLKAAVVATLPDAKRFVVKTWVESQKVIIDAMRLERIIWVVVLSALLAVAGFCILAVMSLTVIQKTRDIGILRAVGASVRGVLAGFLGYGFAVGLVGATLGLVGALVVLHYIDPVEAVMTDGRFAVFLAWLAGIGLLSAATVGVASPGGPAWLRRALGVLLGIALIALLGGLAWGFAVLAFPRWTLDALQIAVAAAGVAAGVGIFAGLLRSGRLPRAALVPLALVLWSSALVTLSDAGRAQIERERSVFLDPPVEPEKLVAPLGRALGVTLKFGREHMSWTPWPRDVFYFEKIPVEIGWQACLSFWSWGVAVALAASLYPAARAARTDPVRTLRIEH